MVKLQLVKPKTKTGASIMISHPNLNNFDEITQTVKDKEDRLSDTLFDMIRPFTMGTLAARSSIVKEKGFRPGYLITLLLLFPFFNLSAVRSFFLSGFAHLSEAQKDTLFRLKNNHRYNWRRFLYLVSKRFTVLAEENSKRSLPNSEASSRSGQSTCMILDDTVQHKRGKKIEGIGRVFDHVSKRYILGFKTLMLAFWDGVNTIPLDFSLHSERGKNKKRPFGLTLKEIKARYSKERSKESHGYKRLSEMTQNKITTGLAMIKRALRHQFIPDYVLVDSWFSSKGFIKAIRSYRKGAIHFLGQLRMDKRKYACEGKRFTARELKQHLKKKTRRSRWFNARYIEAQVQYQGVGEVKLFFSRFSKQGAWHLLLTTDTNLTYNEALRLYNTRWTIEVMFKELKQHLNFGRCQSNDFDAQIADTTISLVTHTILSLYKRIHDYIPLGQIFRKFREMLLQTTLAQRLWNLFLFVVTSLIQILDLRKDIDELIQRIFHSNKAKIMFENLIGKSTQEQLCTIT